MGAIRDHKRRIREHLDEIESAIIVGIENKPVTIGLHTSACAIELLETYLHKEGKIPIGKIIKHDWFKRPLPGQKIEPLIERKLMVSFAEKDKVYNLIYKIEENRTNLVYGRATKEQIETVINSFMELKSILLEKIGDVDE
ncbi:MAG: hypothetical protein V1870_04010 [Candidatus Aenigmatarchaeota archaeon]